MIQFNISRKHREIETDSLPTRFQLKYYIFISSVQILRQAKLSILSKLS